MEFRQSITIDAPPPVVFKALTDEKELAQWFPDEAKFEPRVGGGFSFKMNWVERGIEVGVSGRVLELEPDKKLSYSWDSSLNPSARELPKVTWYLEPLEDGRTRVTVVHSPISEDKWEDTKNGWMMYLQRLSRHCADHGNQSR